jgi:hypothetical protein
VPPPPRRKVLTIRQRRLIALIWDNSVLLFPASLLRSVTALRLESLDPYS